jgi:hypothetical protein
MMAIATFAGGLWLTKEPAPPVSQFTPIVKPSPLPAPPPPPRIQIPSEYRALSNVLSLGMAATPQDLQRKVSNGEMAAMHQALDTLQGITTKDLEIQNTATRAHVAVTSLAKHWEALHSLPDPAPAGDVVLDSFIAGLVSGSTGNPTFAADSMSRAAESDRNASAKQQAAIAVCKAERQVDAVRQSLPRIAKRFAAPASLPGDRFTVDIDDPWGQNNPVKWLSLHNGGAELQGCTLQVQLTGKDGQIRRNIHFLESWPSNSWMYAKYPIGFALPDGTQANCQSVTSIQSVEVTLWSPEFSTQLQYEYQGEERNKDVREYLEPLQLQGGFIPFQRGLLSNTEAGARLTMNGVEYLPPGKITLTFRRDGQTQAWSSEQSGWTRNETKNFRTPAGELQFVPQEIKVQLSFPDTPDPHGQMRLAPPSL